MSTLTKKNIQPKLSLVGAGPGDAELITLKGIKAIEEADAILYDALVNRELLKYAKRDAKIIYVGKRADHHTYKQYEIHSLIAKYAFSYGHVVRLKGGDPFVFGRGHEELVFAESLGIETTLVPGISSSVAVPELQKIPLTKRGTNESFWVITGTTRNGKLSEDVKLAAQSSATVVILMGMKKLKEIREVFSFYGKKETPFAIIQNGSLPEEKIGVGTVEEMEKIAENESLGAPAIIVIGEVVREHEKFRKQMLDRFYFKSQIALN
ncbi:MAG: uroporphyrinogen-III C-methyltransferase [Bacteroidota bacterium]